MRYNDPADKFIEFLKFLVTVLALVIAAMEAILH